MLDRISTIPRKDIEIELWRRHNYSFITVQEGKEHVKQAEALRILTDNETTEFFFGGAAGGAKSWTGCVWLSFECLSYAGTRWFVGRDELKKIKESTLQTFYKVFSAYGIAAHFNGQESCLLFENGSRIDLLELKYYPSDPLYERFGSIEYTGGWIEEAGEVDFGAYDTLKTRIGRQFNDKYNLLRKLFITANPRRNWIFTYFYQPFKDGTLSKEKRFLPALLSDNPFREAGYEAALLSISDPGRKERLLYGNFYYDDDPTALCDFDAIDDCFHDQTPGAERSISADLAMQGRDRFVAGVWFGLTCDLEKGVDKEKSTGKEIEEDLKQLMIKYQVGRSRTCADSDGLGAYLVSYLTGIKTFHGGARAYHDKEFANLKSECAYKLAEFINDRKLKIICSPEQKKRIIEELGILKADQLDGDETKKRIIKKDRMRELIQRSPDYLDMLLMGMLWHCKLKPIQIVEGLPHSEDEIEQIKRMHYGIGR